MATQNPNMTKIIQKLLSDPRVIDVITQALIDILSQESNLVSQSEKITTPNAATQSVKQAKEIDWNAKSDNTLRVMYAYRKKRGMPIEPELHETLVARFPGYDAEQKIFTGRGGRKKSNTAKTANIPQESKPTRHIKKSAVATLPPAKADVVEKPTHLTVTLKPIKQSLEATYNNVYVNGQLILRNHANTELKLFGDGTLLGVYGIVTNDKDLPQRPLWIIYNTNLVANKWAGHDKYSGYSIYVKQILPTSTGINLTLSDKRIILLDNEKLKRMAAATRFEIER